MLELCLISLLCGCVWHGMTIFTTALWGSGISWSVANNLIDQLAWLPSQWVGVISRLLLSQYWNTSAEHFHMFSWFSYNMDCYAMDFLYHDLWWYGHTGLDALKHKFQGNHYISRIHALGQQKSLLDCMYRSQRKQVNLQRLRISCCSGDCSIVTFKRIKSRIHDRGFGFA